MKKRITLLIAAALLTVIGVQAAAVQKQITLTLGSTSSAHGVSWTWSLGDNTSITGSTATFTSDSKESGWVFSSPVKLISFKMSSLKSDCPLSIHFKDADGKNSYYHQWSATDLGETTITNTDIAGWDDKPNTDKIKSIEFFNRGEGSAIEGSRYITFGTITLTFEVDGYDEVINTYEKNSFTLSDANFSNTLWGAAAENVVNTSTGQITYQNEGNAVGWQFSPAIDLTQYDRLVVKVHPQSVKFSGDWWVGVSLFLDVAGKGDNEVYMEKWNSATNNDDSYFTREVDLTKTLKSGVDHDGTEVSVSAVTQFRFRTEGAGLSFLIDEIYLEKDGEQYILRSNTAAGKYGTICLPFASIKPTNATIYDVVGWAETTGSPSALYLEEKDALEAGKAYIFKSTDANDITFTKTGTTDNLDSPAASTNMLHGQFSGEAYVPVNSYILVGTSWKKVVKENQNRVRNYRAYLTLTDDLKVTTATARQMGYFEMDVAGGQTTAIETVNREPLTVNQYYDLSGRRVSQPTKGIYVKNGKKVVIK